MTRVHERLFRVRHYECDAYGHVNNVNYLRYMQEAALDAFAAGGYDLARSAELGAHWVARASEIEYLRPLHYGDQVLVKTWLAGVRRMCWRWAYAFYLADSQEPVARAHTDWVYVDGETGHPRSAPPEMIAAFPPAPDSPQARERFSTPPPPPLGVFAMRRNVMWQDLDAAGHADNVAYLGYASDCGFEVAAAHGWPLRRMQSAGFGIFVRGLRIECRAAAMPGDELEIATWWYGARYASAGRAYVIVRLSDQALLGEVQGRYAWVDLVTGQPIRIPADFMADLAPNRADA